MRGFYSSLKEHEYRQRYRFDFASDLTKMTFNADGHSGVSTGSQRRQDLRLEQKDKTIFTSMVGGENRRGDWVADYSLSYGKNKIDDHDQNWQFRGGSLTSDWDVGPLLYQATPRAQARPVDMVFNQYTNKQTDGFEKTWTGVLNAKRSLDFGAKSYLKFGFKYRDTDKQSDVETPTYGLASGTANRFTLADFNLLGTPTFSYVGDGVIYPNNPTISPDTTPAAINGLIGTRVVLNTEHHPGGRDHGRLRVKEKVAAGYVMASLDFGKLTVLGGLRIEDTRTDASGFRLTNGTTVSPVARDNAYTNILPALHLQLCAEPGRGAARGLHTNTVGRPEYSQISPASSFSYSLSLLAPGLNDGGVSEGNPDLKPYLSWNFDGSAEWYFAKGELLSAGVFPQRRSSDRSSTYRQTLQNIIFLNLPFNSFNYDQPRNADGEISGVEFNYQQQFRFLPGPLAGLGVSANATFTDSSLKAPTRTDTVRFPRQSNSIYGGQFSIRSTGSRRRCPTTGRRATRTPSAASAQTDTFFNDYTRVDAKLAYAITPDRRVRRGQNTNDEILWEYQGGQPDGKIGYERYGRTVYLGVAAKW